MKNLYEKFCKTPIYRANHFSTLRSTASKLATKLKRISIFSVQLAAEGGWQPVPPHREDRGSIKVVWLQGTPYEMGYQHGKLLYNEIASVGTKVLEGLKLAGKEMGLAKLAMRRSFPDVVEECKGLVDAAKDVGMTMDTCMMAAFGDVYQELFTYVLPKVLFPDCCSTFVAAGQATVDGRLYFGRSLDHNTQKALGRSDKRRIYPKVLGRKKNSI